LPVAVHLAVSFGGGPTQFASFAHFFVTGCMGSMAPRSPAPPPGRQSGTCS